MKTITTGIIGIGRIGRIHARTLSTCIPGAAVKTVSDVRTEGLRAFADSLNIPGITDDPAEILRDPEIAAVVICSPTPTHADLAMAAARAGKHIFCEKPIDLDLGKIQKTIAAVHASGVRMQVGFNRRFDHNFHKVQQVVSSGELGQVHVVRITSRDPAPPPLDYIRQSGGLFLDMTIHDFDMAQYLAGSPVVEVYASAAVLVDPAIGEAGDIDTAVINLKFANGALGIIENSRQAVYGYDQRVEVLGSLGAASAANDTPTTVQVSRQDGVHSDKPLYFFLERYMASFEEEMRQFIEAVRTGCETPVTAEDGLAPVRIALAAQRSLQENRPVRIDEIGI
jgi:myo-inositol 2-dehydrogenase/D-chiro-inositol 1-dehydrogenase